MDMCFSLDLVEVSSNYAALASDSNHSEVSYDTGPINR